MSVRFKEGDLVVKRSMKKGTEEVGIVVEEFDRGDKLWNYVRVEFQSGERRVVACSLLMTPEEYNEKL